MKNTDGLDGQAVTEMGRFLRAKLTELSEALRGLVNQRRARDAGRVADETAWATETLHEEIQVALMNRYSHQMSQIEAALERLGQGEYGRCQDCGRFIGLPRLRALPFAQRCSACQSREEVRVRREETTAPLGLVHAID